MKKCSIAFAIILILSISLTHAIADESKKQFFSEGDYKYILLGNGTAEIVNYWSWDNEVTIPASLGGYYVSSIGDDAFHGCRSISKISIPDGIVSIGDHAFNGCSSLSSLIIPEGVEYIGESAFAGCTALTLVVSRDSFAERYCLDNDLAYTYTEGTSRGVNLASVSSDDSIPDSHTPTAADRTSFPANLAFYRKIDYEKYFTNNAICICLVDSMKIVDSMVSETWQTDSEWSVSADADIDVWQLGDNLYFIESEFDIGGHIPSHHTYYHIIASSDSDLKDIKSIRIGYGGDTYTIKTSDGLLIEDYPGSDTYESAFSAQAKITRLNDFFSEYGISFSEQTISIENTEWMDPARSIQVIRCDLPNSRIMFEFNGHDYNGLPMLTDNKGDQSAMPNGNTIPEKASSPTDLGIAVDSISCYSGGYTVTASSYKRNDISPDIPDHAFDGTFMTVWCTDNHITDEWLKISVQDGARYQIAGLRIASGFWGTADLFEKNCSPRNVDIYCDDSFVQRIVLARERNYQTFWFDAPVSCSSIKLVLRDGYQGPNKNDFDCCIADLELLGPAGKQMASSTLPDWGKAISFAESYVKSGRQLSRGDRSFEVMGLQILLKEGFGVLTGSVDGAFGAGTESAVNLLADRMRRALPNCENMIYGAVDAAYWRNMLAYMDTIYEQ